MTRFFVPDSIFHSDTPILEGENARHAKVLRLREGEEVCLSNGHGEECVCRVEAVGESYTLSVIGRRPAESEAKARVSVYMAMPKADKLEHVIQKATELGAYEIVTFPSARCISRPDDKSLSKKLERWQKIAVSAAEQSGRGRIPEVIYIGSYKEALRRAASADKAILFYENEQATTLKMSLTDAVFESISLLTGPEGGLEEREVEEARAAGFDICTLGHRILRCETAPLCALSVVMYATGEF
ncbi:MAG: 16S rRNA (uracil(1498)-N(3))-methyltransferase [Clostridia bacterium]|nr:16S rRNA (uracil(1498)-N(3))-methyltransferase [Clostridia bacterium]